MTPSIATTRLWLHRYTAGMVTETHISWLNNQDLMRFSEQRHVVHTLETQHHYLNSFPIGSHAWLITNAHYHTNENTTDIGTITAYIDLPNKVADIGILIGENGGHGYGLEAWMAVTQYLSSAGIRKIECGCMSRNKPMRKLAVRADMTFEGLRRDHFMVDGKLDDLMMFGRFA